MKTLRSKKLFIATCYNSLSATAPKEFETTSDIEKVPAIIAALKKAAPEFVAQIDENKRIGHEILTGKVNDDAARDSRKEFLARSAELEATVGEEPAEVELENAEFNTFFQFFGKWGKTWFVTVDDYLEFRRQINEANQQPKA